MSIAAEASTTAYAMHMPNALFLNAGSFHAMKQKSRPRSKSEAGFSEG
jgi:hypothetical protein